MSTLAEQLGISESTPRYLTDGVHRHVYVNSLAGIKLRGTNQYIIEPEEFEAMVFPRPEEFTDGDVIKTAAWYYMSHLFHNRVSDRIAAAGYNYVDHDLVSDLVVMWTYSIPINKLHLHGL